MSIPEYLEFRCCMCPNVNIPESVLCPIGPFKTENTPCRYVKTYTDERGWQYRIMGGIGGDCFKARHKKPGKNSWKCMNNVEWRKNFDEAQRDLNALARVKGWEEVNKD